MATFQQGSRTARTANRLVSTGVAAALMLAGAAAPARAAARPTAPPARTPGTMLAAPAPGTYTGLGFDTCVAPSQATMNAWLQSPYRAIGIYIGGINRGCPNQPNLTQSWVSAQQSAGWHLVLLYVGLQAPCTTSSKPNRIDPAMATQQGQASADDAVAQATNLGLPAQSMIIFDMEAYATGDSACTAAVLTFMSAWSARLHERKFLSGFYSSMASGSADQVANYSTPGYTRPDYIDFARWDGVATVDDPAIPATYWVHRRMKQYRGDHLETYGGVTINIDNDYLDFGPVAATPFGDFTVDGWSDAIGRQTSNGALLLYPGSGNALTGPVMIGSGWGGMDVIIRHGDFNRDGYEDVISRNRFNGDLLLYPGTGSGLTSGPRIGTGWGGMREITAVGDYDGDRYNDILAVESATGRLLLYPGRGTSLVGPVQVGIGWNGMDELTGTGDFNLDGYVDLAARQPSTGYLLLYLGSASGLTNGPRIGTGWGGVREITAVGDFDRDGYVDLVAIESSTGNLFLYTGNGTGLGSKIRIGVGWGGIQPLL